MPHSSKYYASTYDSTHGWLMWKEPDFAYDGVVQFTKDGKSFGTFPVPEWAKEVEVRCLESLDNGGDLFMAGSEKTYIFRHAYSSWEQTDVPGDVDMNSSKFNQRKIHLVMFIRSVFYYS